MTDRLSPHAYVLAFVVALDPLTAAPHGVGCEVTRGGPGGGGGALSRQLEGAAAVEKEPAAPAEVRGWWRRRQRHR